jgi:hypothetical protein
MLKEWQGKYSESRASALVWLFLNREKPEFLCCLVLLFIPIIFILSRGIALSAAIWGALRARQR